MEKVKVEEEKKEMWGYKDVMVTYCFVWFERLLIGSCCRT